MHFSKFLYVSDALTGKKDKICRQIKYGTGKPRAYILYQNKDTKLPEMMHCRYLKQKYFADSALEITGIVDSYEEALAYLMIYAIQRYDLPVQGIVSKG